jgi:hypothetical protein
MRRFENFMNWLTDMDWGWWPVVSLRPQKNQDIDNKVLLKLSLVFGSAVGLLAFFLQETRYRSAFSFVSLLIYLAAGMIAFFFGYKISFAYFWNRRARRLRGVQTKIENGRA